MEREIYKESFLIETLIQPGLVPLFLTISSYRKYSSFWVVNPYSNSEQSWYNITSKINNNKFIVGNGTSEFNIILEDGWYSSLSAFNIILQKIKEGFLAIGETVDIVLNPLTNKLTFSSGSATTKTIKFTIPKNQFEESSNLILGSPDLTQIEFTETYTTIDAADLFSNGRFFILKIQLLQFSSSSYLNEPQTLIILSNKSEYGAFIEQSDIMFSKNLFPTGNILNLTLNVVDGKGFPLDFLKPINLRFQIKAGF